MEIYSEQQAYNDTAKIVAALFCGIQPDMIGAVEDIDEKIAAKALSLILSEIDYFLKGVYEGRV